MDVKKVLAIGLLGMAILVSGCGQKPVWVENNPPTVEETHNDPKYAEIVDIGQAGLELDHLNENIAISPDGKLGVLAASKVPKSKLPKGQLVEYETHLVLVDLMEGKASSVDKGQYILPIEWSPAGDKILYRKDDDLYIFDTSANSKHRIATLAYCGSISPDGTKVAFVQRGKGLFVSEIDGTNLKKLTGEPGDWFPVWYPDGRTLFYFADRQVELGDGAGRLQGLGKINVETGDKDILIPDEKGKYRRAEWVVPGRTLLVDKGWDDGFYKMVVNLENGQVYQLGENAGPNTYFTAVDRTEGLVYKAQGNKISGIDAEGRETVSFTLTQPQGLRFSQVTGIAVSPDGKQLAYLSPEESSGGKDRGRRVWVVNADGSSPVQLTGDLSGYHTPVWTPDAGRIIIVVNGNGLSGAREFAVKVIDTELNLK